MSSTKKARYDVSKRDNPKLKSAGSYIPDCVIGNGAYGTVYMAVNSKDNTIVAMKKVKVELKDGLPSSTMREISMLKFIGRLNHPNIIKLLDVCDGEQSGSEHCLYLIFEHLAQDLATFIQNNFPFTEPTIKSLSHQVVCGIDFLHSHRIFHRDLKPQNILVSETGSTVKLADFGLSKTYNYEMKLTSVVVTLWYRSPEVLLNDKYDSTLDVWSTGCIMAELYKGSPLFPGSSESNQLDKIVRVLGTPHEKEWPSDVIALKTFRGHSPIPLEVFLPGLSKEGNDLITKMLRFNPAKRLSAREALKHPYFISSTYKIPHFNR